MLQSGHNRRHRHILAGGYATHPPSRSFALSRAQSKSFDTAQHRYALLRSPSLAEGSREHLPHHDCPLTTTPCTCSVPKSHAARKLPLGSKITARPLGWSRNAVTPGSPLKSIPYSLLFGPFTMSFKACSNWAPFSLFQFPLTPKSLACPNSCCRLD